MRPSKSASVQCAKWVSTVTTTIQSLKIVRREITALWIPKTPYHALSALTKVSSKQGALMTVCLVKAATTATVLQSPISSVNHRATNVLLAFTVREATILSRSPALRELTWTMDPHRLRRISKTAIPHRTTLQICSVTVKSALNTTTVRKAQGTGTSTHVQMDLSAQLDKLTPYLAHQAFSVNEMGP